MLCPDEVCFNLCDLCATCVCVLPIKDQFQFQGGKQEGRNHLPSHSNPCANMCMGPVCDQYCRKEFNSD